MYHTSKRLAAITICVSMGICSQDSRAQQQLFPARTISLVAPFSPGSSADILARRLGDGLKRELAAPAVIVENVGGAGGILGAMKVKNAEPDGYTLLIASQGIVVINPLLRKDLGYASDDFVPLVNLVSFPNVLLVRPSLGVKSVADLVKLAKSKATAGQPLSYGNGGIGTSSDLAAKLFSREAEVELTSVPYKSVADTTTDLLAGRLDIVFGIVGIFEQYVKDGSLVPLAMTSVQRSPLLPDVPTMAEAGYPQAEMNVWMGLFAPKGTPPSVLGLVEKAAIAAIRRPDIFQQYQTEGVEISGAGSASFVNFIENDLKQWIPIVSKLSAAPN
ncbi:Bug family tripartite tricarboxylate transporter substrate binding protein [Bradyrhizobium sp.]|uniref:Bug family tripartite tricarboxylate transporter substrate binding protein n=1 Tax=Bradyrhizobium sp. TaxID=376 RepID=UPI0039E362DE